MIQKRFKSVYLSGLTNLLKIHKIIMFWNLCTKDIFLIGFKTIEKRWNCVMQMELRWAMMSIMIL